MKKYFTYRPIPDPVSNGYLTPERHLLEGFKGLNFSFNVNLIKDFEKDGRVLGYIKSKDEEVFELIEKFLSIFAFKYKTDIKAVEFVSKLIGAYDRETDNGWEWSRGKTAPPENKILKFFIEKTDANS